MNYNKENYKVLQQNSYASKMNERYPKGLPLFNSIELLKSLRDSGYKSTSSAMHELVDNSIEADSSFVYILYKNEGKNITDIYIIDDGHGMDKEMLENAFMTGGTHRHFSSNDLGTIGKYGWGHPAACLYLSKEYETYSKTKNGENWMSVKVDLTENGLSKMQTLSDTGVIRVPEAKVKSDVPIDVKLHLKDQLKIKMDLLLKSSVYKKNKENGLNDKNGELIKHLQEKYSLKHGTVTHIKNPRKHSIGNVGLSRGYKSIEGFARHISLSLAATYRYELIKFGPEIKVNGKKIIPIDPLFLDKNSQFYKTRGFLPKHTETYDENDLKSEAGREKLWKQGIIAKEHDKTFTYELTNKDGKKGTFTVRLSEFGPKFYNAYNEKRGEIVKPKAYGNPFSMEPGTNIGDRARSGLGNTYNYSFFTVTRGNRFIDTVKNLKWPEKSGPTDLRNTDRWYAAEIDFDPVLDEFFGITVNKQTISLSKEVMVKLEGNDVGRLLKKLRREGEKRAKVEENNEQRENEEKHSETATGAAFGSSFGRINHKNISNDKKEKAEKQFNIHIENIMEQKGLSRDEAYENILKNKNPFIKERIHLRPNGQIFECESIKDPDPNTNMAMKIKLSYNSDHPFISKFYDNDKYPKELKDAIDLIFLSWANHMEKLEEDEKLNMYNHITEISRHCASTIQHLSSYYNEE